jgi:nitroimidazol reductase NimA-like FMN-containing flavoprotein (pyridoxamine 5'-phosphate oxidase superfamily)
MVGSSNPRRRLDLESQEQTRQLLKELLLSQRFAVLSTQSGGGPYASLIAFWVPGDLSRVVFATMRQTRKFSHLLASPRVALLFDSRSNRDADVQEAMAVTATGTAAELTDESVRAAVSRQFLVKHPQLASFVAAPGCALVSVAVDTYHVVTHFQNVVELGMPGAAPMARH